MATEDEFNFAISRDAETGGETYHRHGGRAWRHGEPCPYCRIDNLEREVKALRAAAKTMPRTPRRRGLLWWLRGGRD